MNERNGGCFVLGDSLLAHGGASVRGVVGWAHVDTLDDGESGRSDDGAQLSIVVHGICLSLDLALVELSLSAARGVVVGGGWAVLLLLLVVGGDEELKESADEEGESERILVFLLVVTIEG